jgi:lipoprotein signal peptidase
MYYYNIIVINIVTTYQYLTDFYMVRETTIAVTNSNIPLVLTNNTIIAISLTTILVVSCLLILTILLVSILIYCLVRVKKENQLLKSCELKFWLCTDFIFL